MEIYETPAKKLARLLKALLPVILLVIVCLVFLTSISRTSRDTLEREQQTLEKALTHGVVNTYALSGQYPESLSALLEATGITYDRNKFVVEYQPEAANLFPQITVIRLTTKGERS